MLLWIWNMDYPSPEEKPLIYQFKKMVIKAMYNMLTDNKITALKFENKSVVSLNPNYWLEGVNCKDTNAN